MLMDSQLWWKQKGDDAAPLVHSAFESILQDEGEVRRTCLEQYERLYRDEPSESYEKIQVERNRPSRLPVLTSMVDAVLSRIGRARPLPSVLTSDGNWQLKRRARKKSRWLAGMFKKLDVHETLKDCLRDALVFGTGAAKVIYDNEEEEICVENVWAGDLFVEPLEAKYGMVRTLYQTMAVDRSVLIDRYPEHEEAIRSADRVDQQDHAVAIKGGQTDLVLVVEAWRIGTKKTPGKHIICVQHACLHEEKWTKKRFPFAMVRWRKPPRCFWGHGMVEGGRGLQSLINKTAETLEDCFSLSFPFIVYDRSSGFQAEALSNAPWKAYSVNGVPANAVQVFTPPPFGPGYHEYLQSLVSKLFETQGVSELAASSHKPAGLNSGKALLVFQDVESERFLVQGREFENAHVTVSELIIDVAEDIYKDKERPEALRALGGKDALEAIEFKDVRFADKPWEVRVYPITSLSQSPSGRLEQIEMMIGLGAIADPAVVRELLDYPDLERYRSIESAQRDLAEKLIDQCLDKGEVTPANPYMDLPYTRKRAELELALAEIEGAPEDRKEALRDFIGSIDTVAAKQAEAAAQAAQAEAAAAGPMGAPAGPMGDPALVPPEGPDIAGAGAMPGV